MPLKFPPDNASPDTRPWAVALERFVRNLDGRIGALERLLIPNRLVQAEKTIDDLKTRLEVAEARLAEIPNIIVSTTEPDTTDLPVPTVWIDY